MKTRAHSRSYTYTYLNPINFFTLLWALLLTHLIHAARASDACFTGITTKYIPYEPYDPYGFPAGVGWVNIATKNSCAAVLIADDVAVLAASCLIKQYSPGNNKLYMGMEYMFVGACFEIGAEYNKINSAYDNYIVMDSYINMRQNAENNNLMLLHLKQNLSSLTGYSPINIRKNYTTKQVYAIGFFDVINSGDILTNVPGYGRVACNLNHFNPATMLFTNTCPRGIGFIGAPIFDAQNNKLIAFNQGNGNALHAVAAKRLLQAGRAKWRKM